MEWERCYDYEDIAELFEIVEPSTSVWDRDGMLKKHQDKYRCYMCKNENEEVIAMGLMCWLNNNEVLHIDSFSLHPKIRGKGLAKYLFNKFLDYVNEEFSETKKYNGKLLIEVYTKNVEAWRKIMGVEELEIKTKPIHLEEEVVIMGKGLQNNDEEVYSEWQEFQKQW